MRKQLEAESDLKSFLKAIRKFTDIDEIDERIVNTLIGRIEIFERVKIDGKLHLPIKIHFTAVGVIDIPTEKEILRVMEEIRNKSKTRKTA